MNQSQDFKKNKSNPSGKEAILLSLGALGIVFGDIGTSPLYAFRECFSPAHGLVPTPENIIGILSLIFWSLILVISLKYLFFFFKADNKGEGGTLALLALLTRQMKEDSFKRNAYIILALAGTALLYGDGIITPSISVLSAVEGLEMTGHFSDKFIVPISIFILCILFFLQKHGTAKIGNVFGPVILVWFIAIGLLGIHQILYCPEVLKAVSPFYGLKTLLANKFRGFAILGTVFLAITGGEVLYADMGHFGKSPIRQSWFTVVLPALLLNYFGQGAFLILNPENTENLFFRLCPSTLVYPLVALATVATVIASQAVISGAFSLTRQAIQLGFLPRMHIVHTSSKKIGQVYLPFVNYMLLAGTLMLIIIFRNSGNLAAAYGIAVSGTMLITTILAAVCAKKFWNTSYLLILSFCTVFLAVDMAFFSSCATKIVQGGWIPLMIAACIFALMIVWKDCREMLRVKIGSRAFPEDFFVKDIESNNPIRIEGTAVFLTGGTSGIPRSLLHNFKHNKFIHTKTILLSVITEDKPFVKRDERAEYQSIGLGLHRITLKYGFSEDPDIPEAISGIKIEGVPLIPEKTTFFLGRETLVLTPSTGFVEGIKKRLFLFMSRNAFDASTFFKLPPGRVIELGLQVEL